MMAPVANAPADQARAFTALNMALFEELSKLQKLGVFAAAIESAQRKCLLISNNKPIKRFVKFLQTDGEMVY